MQQVAWEERRERLRALGLSCDEYEGFGGDDDGGDAKGTDFDGREDHASENGRRWRRRRVNAGNDWLKGVIKHPQFEPWKWKVTLGIDGQGRRRRGHFGEEGTGEFQILDLARRDGQSPSAVRGENKRGNASDGESDRGLPKSR